MGEVNSRVPNLPVEMRAMDSIATQTGAVPRWDHDGRRAERLDVRLKASLRETGLTKFDVSVIDLSVSGFRFETSYNLYPETRVWLTIPGMAGLESIVAWRDHYRYGCRFVSLLHVAVFDHIMSHHGASRDV